jgi:hypothetical protein
VFSESSRSTSYTLENLVVKSLNFSLKSKWKPAALFFHGVPEAMTAAQAANEFWPYILRNLREPEEGQAVSRPPCRHGSPSCNGWHCYSPNVVLTSHANAQPNRADKDQQHRASADADDDAALVLSAVIPFA